MPGEIAGKVVVVIGGSRGIGREIAVDFARQGAQTVIVSSSAENLASATKTIAAANGPAPLAINTDLRKLEGCQQAFNTVKEKFNRCDVLVNSAGATKAGNFVDLPDEAKNDGVNVNVIHPGATETERFYQLIEQRSKASGKSVEQLKQEATAKDGLRRLGRADDISALTLFLCSEKARPIQGTAIAVDGGSTAGHY